MTNQERLLIEALFEHLGQADAPRDPEVESLIAARIKEQPGAVYTLAQAVLIQNQELAAAEARIVNLQAKLDKANGASGGTPVRRDILRNIGGMEKAGAPGFLATAAMATLAVAGM